MTTVSLVVTTYNRPDALACCLHSIARQTRRPVDVIVADDGSGPETAALVAETAPTFPVPLRHAWQEDTGFRAARVRNLGTQLAGGDYVVFLDGDMLLHPRFVEDHLRLVRPGVYLQGGRLNASEEETRRLIEGGTPEFSPRMPFAPHVRGELRPKHARRIPLLAWYNARRSSTGIAMSCNLGVWRADLVRVNGFDEAYEGWGREDDDLTVRLRHSGVQRRLLRYAGLAIHLWHRTRWPNGVPAEGEIPNDALLRRTIAERRIRCEHGLDGHADDASGGARLSPARPSVAEQTA